MDGLKGSALFTPRAAKGYTFFRNTPVFSVHRIFYQISDSLGGVRRKRRLTFCRKMHLHSTTIPQPRSSHSQTNPDTTQPIATQPQPFHNHLHNHPTTAFYPRANHRKPQPIHNRPSSATRPPRSRETITTTPHLHYNHIPAARSRQTDNPSLGKKPRLNHPSCRIQERFRLNHPTSTILESTTLSCMALARSSTASAVALLPTPPATRRRSPSCRQCCRERCRRGETQNP